MLAQSRLESVDLAALLNACAAGYRSAFPAREFAVDCAAGAAPCPVVPEAIVQALDKLVSNAVDFASAGSPVVLSLRRADEADGSTGEHWVFSVRNQGPPLPNAMRDNLFDSMVSIRDHRGGGEAHLGLGLYLVRLVAEFHGGHAFARDVADGVEVGFTVASPSRPD
jgi:signal transduction histidine kinase